MGTLKTQFSEAFGKLEEAISIICSLIEKIREDIGEEQSVPLPRSREEIFSRLFPYGPPLEMLKSELEKNKAKYEEKKASLQAEIEEVLAKLHRLETEHEGIEKKYRHIEEIYQDLFGDSNGPKDVIDADKAYSGTGNF